MNHLEIVTDIETMSSSPRAAVIGIGIAVIGQVTEGDEASIIRTFEVLIDPRLAYPVGDLSPDTFLWWSKQDNFQKAWSGKTSPMEAIQLVDWFLKDTQNKFNKDIKATWANPPSFDYVILRNMWDAHGFMWIPSHRTERCFRTLLAMYKEFTGIEPERVSPTEPHMPLSDAIAEAQTIINLRRKLYELQAIRNLPGSTDLDGEVPRDRGR